MPRKGSDASPVYQLKVILQGTKPPIWRRIQIRASATLPKLHDTIQVAMGWTDAHLEAEGIAHSPVRNGQLGWVVGFEDPDGIAVLLYTLEAPATLTHDG